MYLKKKLPLKDDVQKEDIDNCLSTVAEYINSNVSVVNGISATMFQSLDTSSLKIEEAIIQLTDVASKLYDMYAITGAQQDSGAVYDESIRELVVYTLNSQGLEAQGFERPSLFWKALEKELPSLVLLDIMLPEEDGLSILKKIRIRPDVRKLPVIMLTAKGSEFDTVVGLDSGADDYIPKPFRMMELISRVRALLRRAEDNGAEEYRMENLYVCPGRHEVTVDQEPVNLTLKEYEMLCLLLKNSGTVLSRTQLLNQIWGYEFDGESRTVDVHIRTLRQKLGPAGDLVETVRGVGYKISGKCA